MAGIINLVTIVRGYENYYEALNENYESSVEIMPGRYVIISNPDNGTDLLLISSEPNGRKLWVRSTDNYLPDEFTVTDKILCYKTLDDAKRHTYVGSGRLNPGTYYVYGVYEGNQDILNLTRTPGRRGVWVWSTDHSTLIDDLSGKNHASVIADKNEEKEPEEEPEPETFFVKHSIRGYKYFHDAQVRNESGYVEVLPGSYYLLEKSSTNPGLLRINNEPTGEGVWILSSDNEVEEPDKFTVYQDIHAYLSAEYAYQKFSGFTLSKGEYYVLWYTSDGLLAYIAPLTSPMGPGWYIRLEDNVEVKEPEKYTVYLPLNGYHSVEDALKDEGSDCMKFTAGEYYLLGEFENGKVGYLSPTPYGPGHFANLEKNVKNQDADTSDGTGGTDVEASNTGTTSGLDDKSTTAGSLTGKDANLTYSAGTYDCPDCFIKNLVTGTTIPLRTGMPEGLSDSASADFEPAEIRGRSAQIQGYSSTESRTVSFSYTFHEEFEPEGLLTTIARIKALEYPNYKSMVIPPKCYLRLGNAVRGTFICTGADVSYMDEAGTRDEYPLAAEVSFSFIETNDFARSAAEIEDGGGMLK